MDTINTLFEQLHNTPIDYHLPIFTPLSEEFNPYDAPDYALSAFTGAYTKKSSRPEHSLTLQLSDLEELIDEKAKSSTERVRKYYKRHPEKVRKYLKDTVKERSQRNKDRRKAIKKHGKTKMKNHDVHHPNGPGNGWRLTKKDHGRDKKDGTPPETGTSKPTPKKSVSKQSRKKRATPKFHNMLKKIQQFVAYASEKLQLSTPPKVKVIQPTDNMTSLGHFEPDTQIVNIVIKGRLLADILRTVAHELVHAKQYEMGQITNPAIDGATGSSIENQANAVAGVLMRQYGQENTDIFLAEHLLMEGGAAGHLAHPFEDEDLTFADMKEMLKRGLIGGLDQEAPVTEKLDGQNIAFSVRDGQIIFARNKSHVKNRGKNALDTAGIRQMFAGRGNIEKAFTGAAEDLQAAVKNLSPEQVKQMFGGGSRFMSLEVILPDTQNVIPYGKSVLVMHGSIEYDEDGNEIGRSNTDGQEFADMVTAVNAQRQKTFGIEGPRTIAFSDAEAEKYQERYETYAARLDRVAQEFDLDEKATLAEYRRAWWERELTKQMQDNGIELSEKEFNGLISRWADGSKKFGVKDIENDETKKWFREFEKSEVPKMQKSMIKPVEMTFLQAGTDTLRRVTNFLSANNPEASLQLKRDVLQAIQAIRDSDQPDKIAKLQRELERLDGMGVDNIVPSEGVVFIYNGKPYKYTGQFAPINQITGTFKFEIPPKETEEPTKQEPKTPEKEPEPETSPEQPTQEPEQKPETPARTVAIFTGRFQPFHAGHYSIYEALVKRFGKENVYIASSDKTEATKSPFRFKDKEQIMTQMFDIPEEMIVQVKNPYAPVEILDKLPDNTRYVTAVSQKDAERLGGGKYFRDFDEVPEEERKGFKDQGYFIVAPEMQLSVDGKNISGTQLRAVMGDPQITDRAKKEIFTKVYGKFDQQIFDKIVKTTTASEEARKLTDQHGKTDDKRGGKGKKPDAKAVARAKSVLRQKVRNPKTKREILVATALTYDKNDPARKAAERLIQQAMQQKEHVLMETKQPSKDLEVYIYVRNPSDEEIKIEIGEYFENEKTLKAFPDLADSSYELKDMIKTAPTDVLEMDELKALQNSDVGDILSGKDKKTIFKQMIADKKDVVGLLKDVKAQKKIAMPVVIKHTSGYYLLGGNTRLSVLASLGKTMPVKVLGHAAPFDAPISVYPEKEKTTASKKKGDGKALFNSLLKMRITNPETGNEIKIDTAMDYPKEHPAHRAARAVIRQRMRGLSNRAGIPKDSGPK